MWYKNYKYIVEYLVGESIYSEPYEAKSAYEVECAVKDKFPDAVIKSVTYHPADNVCIFLMGFYHGLEEVLADGMYTVGLAPVEFVMEVKEVGLPPYDDYLVGIKPYENLDIEIVVLDKNGNYGRVYLTEAEWNTFGIKDLVSRNWLNNIGKVKGRKIAKQFISMMDQMIDLEFKI